MCANSRQGPGGEVSRPLGAGSCGRCSRAMASLAAQGVGSAALVTEARSQAARAIRSSASACSSRASAARIARCTATRAHISVDSGLGSSASQRSTRSVPAASEARTRERWARRAKSVRVSARASRALRYLPARTSTHTLASKRSSAAGCHTYCPSNNSAAIFPCPSPFDASQSHGKHPTHRWAHRERPISTYRSAGRKYWRGRWRTARNLFKPLLFRGRERPLCAALLECFRKTPHTTRHHTTPQ